MSKPLFYGWILLGALWFVFAFSYAGRVAEGQLLFLPLLLAALGGLGLRIAARRAQARRRVPSAREAA